MKILLLVLALSACAAPPINTDGLSFEQKMQLYDRMKLTPYMQPYYPVQIPQHTGATCQQISPAIVQCY